jgi:hypothetical protein
MRTLLRSILAFLTLGMCTIGCNKPDAPATPTAQTDVVLDVPAMN